MLDPVPRLHIDGDDATRDLGTETGLTGWQDFRRGGRQGNPQAERSRFGMDWRGGRLRGGGSALGAADKAHRGHRSTEHERSFSSRNHVLSVDLEVESVALNDAGAIV